MAKAVLCPVCNGRGTTKSIDLMEAGAEYPCNGCGGKGWVEVREDSPLPFYWIPGPMRDSAKCPACGGDRNDPPLTGCPKGSHYGAYCDA